MPAKRRTYESQLSFHRVSSKVSDACSFKSLLKAPYVFRKANVQPYVMSGKEHSALYSGSTLDARPSSINLARSDLQISRSISIG